jgi:hypothetical protein
MPRLKEYLMITIHYHKEKVKKTMVRAPLSLKAGKWGETSGAEPWGSCFVAGKRDSGKRERVLELPAKTETRQL